MDTVVPFYTYHYGGVFMHFDAFIPAFLIFVVLGVVLPWFLSGVSMENRNTEY